MIRNVAINLHTKSVAYWTEGKLRKKIIHYASDGLIQNISMTGFVAAFGTGNSTTVSTLIAVPENYNTAIYGPITIDDDGTLTIGANANVRITDFSDVLGSG